MAKKAEVKALRAQVAELDRKLREARSGLLSSEYWRSEASGRAKRFRALCGAWMSAHYSRGHVAPPVEETRAELKR